MNIWSAIVLTPVFWRRLFFLIFNPLSAPSHLHTASKYWVNPAKGIQKLKEADPKRRFLSTDELGYFITALDKSDRITAAALKLLLLTGLWRMELFSLPWSEVDLEAGTARLKERLPDNVGRSYSAKVVIVWRSQLEILSCWHYLIWGIRAWQKLK